MSIQAIAWVLEHSEATLANRLVLLAIANHADANGWNAYPSIPRIAAEARLNRSTVYRALDALVDAGEIVCRHRPGYSNMYGIAALQGSQSETPRGRNLRQKGSQSEKMGSQSETRTVVTVNEPAPSALSKAESLKRVRAIKNRQEAS